MIQRGVLERIGIANHQGTFRDAGVAGELVGGTESQGACARLCQCGTCDRHVQGKTVRSSIGANDEFGGGSADERATRNGGGTSSACLDEAATIEHKRLSCIECGVHPAAVDDEGVKLGIVERRRCGSDLGCGVCPQRSGGRSSGVHAIIGATGKSAGVIEGKVGTVEEITGAHEGIGSLARDDDLVGGAVGTTGRCKVHRSPRTACCDRGDCELGVPGTAVSGLDGARRAAGIVHRERTGGARAARGGTEIFEQTSDTPGGIAAAVKYHRCGGAKHATRGTHKLDRTTLDEGVSGVGVCAS